MLFSRLLAHMRQRPTGVPFTKLRYLYAGGDALDPALKQEIEAVTSCRYIMGME